VTTTYRWPGVDLDDLACTIGAEAFERIVFHIAAFELNKLCVLEPDTLDFGPWGRFATRRFEQVWCQVFRHVWAQWRFENNSPDYLGPRFSTVETSGQPVTQNGSGTLLFCGGGKDSLVAARLLERAGHAFDSYAYSHSIYGAAGPQHQLIDGLLDHLAPRLRFRAGYRAHLPRTLVDTIFSGEDLLAVPENQRNFERLFSQRPFECVGEVDEARLFLGELDPRERARLVERYTIVSDEHRIPADLAAGILPQLRAAARRIRLNDPYGRW
jgi:hypothetical protein